ncbi:MAG: hypothetical protein ACOY94_24630 [Bacillota bacterium]
MSWNLIPIGQAAKLLHVHPTTLRYNETRDGQWTEVMGMRIRVYRFDGGQRRYDRAEILSELSRFRRELSLR